MSYIIQQKDNLLFNFAQIKRGKTLPNLMNHKSDRTTLADLQEMLIKNLTRNGEAGLATKVEHRAACLYYHMNKIYKNISMVLLIRLSPATQQLTFSLKLLNLAHRYMLIEGKQRRKLICKILCNRLYQHLFPSFKICVDSHRGQIKIETAITHYVPSQYKQIKNHVNLIIAQLKQQLACFHEPFTSILQISNDNLKTYMPEIFHKLGQRKIQKIYQYSGITGVALNLGSQTTHEEQLLNVYLRRESESIDCLKRNYLPPNRNFLSAQLFTPIDQGSPQSKDIRSFQINFLQRQRIHDLIELPSMQKAKNPHENCFVLNYIRVNKKLSQTCVRKINSGGFTSIYLSEIQYWYVGSYCLTSIPDHIQNNSPPHKKYIIIKRQDKNVVKMGGKSRISHERFILQKIKNGISMFLPKYYLLAEKDNSYENDLLVDYISYPNLSEYLSKHKHSISLQTKIYLLVMITQGLRYLQEYKIAHLDLKPTNIMMHRKMGIKLIDFGESYHPDLKDHQPGFSMPYSAPQNYNYPESYSYKNDVFSIGIILHELLYGRYPFYIYSQKLRDEIYRRGDYYNRWFMTPEENMMSGDHIVGPMLNLLIGKCLHPDPKCRPQLEWIVLILRECLAYFYY